MVAIMAQPVSRLRLAGDWYLQAVDAIPADGWTKPSLCEGWTASHVVAHVTTGDQLFRGLIFDATGRDRAGQHLPIDFADRQQRFQEAATWEPAKLKEAAHKESEQTVASIAEAIEKTPQAMVNVPFGLSPMPVVRALRLNEYIIHGHDLTPAIGRKIPIPDWFIDRGLGDSFTLMTRLHQRSPHKGKSASFHIHRTDGEGDWIVRAEGGQAVTESTHGKADAALRGPGEGLYWVLMGRGKPEEHGVEVHGDAALASRFKEWFPGP
jgi:uncharacterized protein (TIGR03083 family)